MAAPLESRPDIVLNSPVGAKAAVYKWPLTYSSKGQKIDGAEEIVETIRWVAREYLEFKPAIENLLPDRIDTKSYECIKSLCDKYNKIPEMVLKLNKGTSVAPKTSSRASQGLLKHIIQQVYNEAVKDPTELNKYSPFSSETYGETNFEFMAQLISKNQFRPKEQDTFIDLGSGVGHIVLQMAASIECKKCYGIEISDVPATYAKTMENRFKFWMNWHGKTYTEFELFHGDFFEKKYVDLIKNSTYILVNNYAFKPEVDHKLKERFLDLKDGTQILSSKPFCSPKARVTERHLTDIGSIMRVIEIIPEQKKDTVSWTPKPLPYYLHVLDGSPVEKYYERKKRKKDRSVERGKPNKRRRSEKNSDSMSDCSEDNVVYGPTTRKAWSEWCNATNASNRASADSIKTGSSRNNSTDTENYECAIENDDQSLASARTKEGESPKRKTDTQSSPSERATINTQISSTDAKTVGNAGQTAKSCLDKKRDYASKKSGSNLLQSAPPSALYSISKPPDPSNGSSPSKIPNIVIKVKPTLETKVANNQAKSSSSSLTSTSASTSTASTAQARSTAIPNQTTPDKVNDENGKKLRQRKKPSTATDLSDTKATTRATSSTASLTSKSGVKAETKSSQQASSSTSMFNKDSNSSRTKKAQPATKQASGKAPANSRRRAVSSDKSSSLDLLHAKTVESVSGSAGYFPKPAFGCQDHSLFSIKDTPSLPQVVIKDLSMFIGDNLGPKTLERVTDCVKQEMANLATKLQQPGARESLSREIEKERMRQNSLYRKYDEIIREIKSLDDRARRLMKHHCEELGVTSTIRSIVSEIGVELRRNQDLNTVLNNQPPPQYGSTLHTNQRTMNPPAAHSSTQSLTSPYKASSSSSTLDLSLKQSA